MKTPTVRQNSSLVRVIPDNFQTSFFVNARFNMHEGTYRWNQDDSLIKLSEWYNSPGFHQYEPFVPRWIYLRKSTEILTPVWQWFFTLHTLLLLSFARTHFKSFLIDFHWFQSNVCTYRGVKKSTSCLEYRISSFTNCQEKERADEFDCHKKEYYCASDFENAMKDKESAGNFINARNASHYFEAEENCRNENSVLVSTFEPEFSPSHLDKLKELTKYKNEIISNWNFQLQMSQCNYCFRSRIYVESFESSKRIFGCRSKLHDLEFSISDWNFEWIKSKLTDSKDSFKKIQWDYDFRNSWRKNNLSQYCETSTSQFWHCGSRL